MLTGVVVGEVLGGGGRSVDWGGGGRDVDWGGGGRSVDWGGGGRGVHWGDDDELMLNVLRCHLTY